MQLALAAGILDVDSMLDSMTSKQFSEWQAFYLINPFGAGAETSRFATQQANILNGPHFSTKKVRDSSEFMPQFKTSNQTVEEQITIMKGLG